MVYTISGETNKENGSIFKGLLISFIASIPFFTHGVETVSRTTSAHSSHFISIDDGIWNNTALLLAGAISSPLYCCFVDKCGRKTGLFVISIVQGISLIPLFLVNSANTIIFHAITGFSAGGIFTVIPIYVKEVTQAKVQGPALLFMLVMTSAGYLMNLVMSLEERMYLTVALVMAQLGSLPSVIESPTYWVIKGKFEAAKESLSKLNKVPPTSEFVATQLGLLKEESERAKCNGKITLLSLFRNKIWWDSFKLVVVLFTTMTLCGSILFLDQSKTLKQLKVTQEEGLLYMAPLMAGGLFSFVTIFVWDRKYLLTAGFTTMALSSGLIAVFTQVDLTVISHHWVAYTALVALVFGYGICWGLPVVILVEIFNFEIRTPILATLLVYSRLLNLAHIHLFQYLEDSVGVYTLFYFYAAINLYGAVYSLFMVPSIRNKKLVQIEKQMKRIPLT